MAQPGPNGTVIEVVVARPSFCLGEIIQGSLNVSPFVAAPIVCISMELVCEYQLEVCETAIETHRVENSRGDMETRTRTVYHYFPYSKDVLHTQPVDVFDTRASGGVLFSSPSSIPFAIPLPDEDLPSSLRSFRGNKNCFGVKYYLKINAFDITERIINTTRCEVKVFSLFGYVGPEQPMLLFGRHEYKVFCCFPVNKFVVYFTTDRTVYCPGDKIKISYWIETDKPDTLPKFRSVVASFIINATSTTPPGVGMCQQRSLMGQALGATVQRGGSQPQSFKRVVATKELERPVFGSVSIADLTLPSDCGPAFTSSSIVECTFFWTYTLTVRVKLNNILGSYVDIVLPVAINGKNTDQLAPVDNPIPLRVKHLPASVYEAQQLYASITTSLAASAVPVYTEAPALSVMNGEDGGRATEKSYVSVPVVE